MQIVIDIPDEEYEDVKKAGGCYYDFGKAIYYGTPLPKGHGRLIDADATCKDIIHALGIRDENYLLEAEKAIYKRIKNAPTIIDADTESEDKE